MATATFIKSARKNIYVNGKRVEYVSQKGKREGQTLSKIDRTIPQDENDRVLIARGESYWTWSFMNGGTFVSKTKPRESQLTSSEFMSTYYSIKEEIEDWAPESVEDVESFVETIKEEIESLKDETQEKLDNMPEQLKYAPVGELLQERIDSLDETYNELDFFDYTYEEPEEDEIKEKIAEEEGIDTNVDGWEETITEDQMESMKDALITEWLEEKVNEMNEISFEL